jgi:glycosyltransferase involved in cell wall biosynthesis
VREFGRTEAKTVCCHNGVDVDRFQPAAARVAKQELGLDPHVPVIGAIGRLALQKGLRYLLAAAAIVLSVAQAHFLIVGDGEEEQKLRSQVAALGIDDHVTFAGYAADPRPYIAAIDIGVLPSLHEGLSLTLLEFMASGKPTVVSDHPGLTEAAIDGVTGLVVPRRDPHRLAEAIVRLVREPAFGHRLGTAARARAVSEFSFDRHAQQVMLLYDGVVG